MPEESFEQQARRKAEEFSMEPKPEVWHHVHSAITPEERRRRVLILWWLLPLCLAGGVGVWLAGNRGSVSDNKRAAVTVNDKKVAVESSPDFKEEKKAEAKREIDKRKEQKRGDASQHQFNIILSGKSKNTKRSFLVSSPGSNTKSEEKISEMTISEGGNDIVKGKEEHDVVMNRQVAIIPDTTAARFSIDQSSIIVGNSLSANVDTLFAKEKTKRDTTLFAKKLTLPDTTTVDNAGKRKKQPQKKSWQIGAMAEIGVVSWTKGLLSNEKSISNGVSSLPLNDVTVDSLMSAGTAVYQSKNGISTGAGVVIRKALSNRFYVTTQLSYRYQQYQVYQYLRVAIPQTAFNNTSYFIGSDDYRAHFLNLGVNAGAKLWAGKRNALSVEAGIDNGFLFIAQKKDNIQTGAFRFGGNVAANFYRWQPQLSLSLPFDWHKGDNIKFQVAPYARFGLHTFQKNGNSYKDNHLVSVGVQAVYFFK